MSNYCLSVLKKKKNSESFKKEQTKKIKSLKINGLHCFDRLECYINLFQHEIVHLLIAIFCTKNGYGMGGHTVMFRNIAFNLFGHTEYKHFLLAGDSIKMEEKEKINKSKIDIGDIVESIKYKKKGFVTNLQVNMFILKWIMVKYGK